MHFANDTWETAAAGTTGRVSIVLMYQGERERRWLCQISFGYVDAAFEVSGCEALRALEDFIGRHSGSERREETRVGTFSGCGVFIVKGDVHPQEFLLHAGGDRVWFQLLFAGEDSASLARALKLAIEDYSADA